MQVQTEKHARTSNIDSKKKESSSTNSFNNTRPEAIQIQLMQQAADAHSQVQPIQKIVSGGKPIQLAKEAALKKIRDKDPGSSTPTKIIKTKGGEIGVFRFPQGSGNIIDTFNGTNIATSGDETEAKKSYSTAKIMPIPVKVADHNLGADYTDAPKLSDSVIKGDDRNPHFKHADDAQKTSGDRPSYTWHHKASLGKMELVDMNVHGAMWHYGGIASWGASSHKGTTDDDPTSDD
ncbi:MAG: HNH endonuclease [Fluviicola sp.]